MTTNNAMLLELIEETARDTLNEDHVDLVLALIAQESSFNRFAVRYEPNWKWVLNPRVYARTCGITENTEKELQKFSWGLMQIMGTVARELGFKGDLTQLVDPCLNVTYGCRKLNALFRKYGNLEDVISSYNQGSPVKKGTLYKNQVYVQTVLKRLELIRSSK